MSGSWVADEKSLRRAAMNATAASFLLSLIPLGASVLMLLSMRVVQGMSLAATSLLLLALLGGIAGSVISDRLVIRTGRCKPFCVGFGLASIAGILASSAIGPQTTSADLAWRLALSGVALGAAMRMFAVVQHACASGAGARDAKRIALITQLAGALLGIGLFAAYFTHSLAPELPRYVPLLPGEQTHHLTVAQAQAEAIDVAALRPRIDAALEGRLDIMERAYRGDQAAAQEILADARLPEAMKASLRGGGIRARVHQHLEQRAAYVAERLRTGEQGREALLEDPLLPPGLKRQIANVPERAFLDEDSSARVAGLFRDAILAREDAVVAATTEHSLRSARAAAAAYGDRLVERIQQGLKEAFAAAIAQTFHAAAWVVALAVLIVALTAVSVGARAGQ